MAEFALYIGGEFRELRKYDSRPENIAHKAIAWYPVSRQLGTPFVGIEGDYHVIRSVDPATVPPPVPESITDWQFFQQLAIMGLITEAEAEAAVAAGELPQTLSDLVDMLPEQARFPTRMLLKGSTTFRRGHEMTDTIAWLYGFSNQDVDNLFRAASVLA